MARVLTRRHYINKRGEGCKNEPSHPRCTSWSLLYILSYLKAQLTIGFEYEPRDTGHFGLIFDQNFPFSSKIEFWYALNCVEPSLRWLENQKYHRAFGLVSIVFGY